MKYLAVLALLVGSYLAGASHSPAPRNAGPVNSDVVLAFGSDSCGVCVRNKPRLHKLQSEGVSVVYLDNITNSIPLPLYLLVRNGEIIVETNSFDELKSSL